ncbi:MAG TPA: hypothetical protein PKX73_12210 [Anaerohalosphaeraceae bacterium]|nr:hypothetical protein [Kiritimatiellia bacterium]HQJ68962.1 hypothetical protein [Anaerohalosphaeraceae bacterium]
MPKKIVSNSFVSGEISPELYGRHDLNAYFNGAARLENFIVRRTGGIRKRAGTNVILTLDAEAEENSGTLDNKFKIFTYYFDSACFGLLIFRLTEDGVLQSRLSIYEDGTTDTTEWANVAIATEITATADFDALQCKQVGDTLFFTRLGHQAFLCAITKESRTTAFSMIENAVVVPTPNAITAVASNFDTSVHKKIEKQYALYGVKDGIFSKPVIAKVNGTTPWTQGATIKVTGTMDFSLHDYYILAKKTGMNFGKISEIYPSEQIDSPQVTIDSSDLEDENDGTIYMRHEAGFTKPSPNTLASSKTTQVITDKALFIRTTEYDDGGTTKYRCATPHFRFNIASPSFFRLNLTMRPYAVRSDELSAEQVSYPNRTVTVTPFWYSHGGTEIHLLAPRSLKTTAESQLNVDYGNLSGDIWAGLIIESSDAWMQDFIPIGGLVASTASWALYTATDARYSIPEEEADLYGDDNATKTICTPTMFGKARSSDEYWVTSAWNAPEEPIDIYTKDKAWTDAYYQKKVSKSLPPNRDFHAAAYYGSSVEFTMDEYHKEISSITFYIGAKTLVRDTGELYQADPPGYITATLYAVDGATEVSIATININAGLISAHKAEINYADVAPTLKYKLVFDRPIVTRGISISTINTELEFVDDNVVPSDITGQQDMLTVGDNNMDCAAFDIHQQRSMYASSKNLPFTLWFSAVGDLYNFYANRPQSDDNAFSVTIPAKRASRIIHALSAKDLMLFTEDGVYSVTGEGNVISHRTVQLKKICDAAASDAVSPIPVDTKVLYVGEDGRTMFELAYNLMEDAITPIDRTIQAYHMTETSGIVKIAYQRYPDSIVWCLKEDGTLIGMTYMPEHEVWAWHQHAFADTDDGRELVDIMDIGTVESGPGVETTSGILLIFKTGTKTIVEQMRPNVCEDTHEDATTAHCVDHYGDEDAEVAVKATLITLRPESPEVSSQGVPKRVVDVCLRIRRSGAVSVKPYEPNLPAVSENKATVDGDGTVHLYSGDIKIMPRGYINNDGQMQIESNDILPCEILSIVYTMDLP